MKYLSIWNKWRFKHEKILLDDEEYERVETHSWYIENINHVAFVVRSKIKGKTTSLSNFIMNQEDQIIDHKDRDPFNNQKLNFRFCTQQQNVWNQGPRYGYKYKGVSYHKMAKKWSAQIVKNYKKKHLGLFNSDIEAAKAYDRAARKLFGEFAYLNFPETEVIK